ncbi:hypothetical protein J5N97_016902 [Dioscorea zingiberensis]|uniref:Zinc-finger domain-containing protein n=1 Tax=Dioscorea zingiberensis TaxID=325984 RepID=A0A9D5CM53_9LILI|nr:hypothetical protein J5N97_016902 [Dioscorea zingiberensis]
MGATYASIPLRRSSRLKSEHGVPGASSQGEATIGGVKANGDPNQCLGNGRTSEKKAKHCSGSPLGRSLRLGGLNDSSPKEAEEMEKEERQQEEKKDTVGVVSPKCHYESLREARILENKTRMASLGINDKAEELCSMVNSTKCMKIVRNSPRSQRSLDTPIRRSERLKGSSATVVESKIIPARKRLFLGRCGSTGRGTIYDSVLGISCHFCRQKTLCWEDDCKHCRDGDIDAPCIGKTECSSCHSSNGILCRPCLKVRYGEELEDVRMNKGWMCPHCIEDKGINPFWICNSSICLKKRKMAPTGIAIYQAREMGYESVAHLIMYKLKRKLGHH